MASVIVNNTLPESYYTKIGSAENSPIPVKDHVYESLSQVVANTNNWNTYSSSRVYWKLRIEGDNEHSYGKVSESTIDGVRAAINFRGECQLMKLDGKESETVEYEGLKGWSLDEENKEITVLGSTKEERSQVFQDTWKVLRPQANIDLYATLLKYRAEDEAVFGPSGEEVFRCERSMTVMFGLPGYGMLAIMYYINDDGEYRFATGLRNADKATYPAMWDVVTGGCVSIDSSTGLPSTAEETLFKEGQEEASLEKSLLEDHKKLVGAVCYTTVRDHKAVKNQTKWDYYVHDDVMTVFELKVDHQIELTPMDGEVQYFEWASATQLINGMLQGDFKPNCALAISYVLLRLGLLQHLPAEQQAEIAELVFTKPEFPLSEDVKSSLAKCGFETIEAQRDAHVASVDTSVPAEEASVEEVSAAVQEASIQDESSADNDADA